jgi:VWFA-related protein
MRKGTTPLLPLLLAALLANAFARPQQQTPPPAQPRPQTTPAPQTAPGQEAQDDDDEVVRITTNLVQVDAVVTDRDGRQVTNLAAEDFEISENGKPRQVTNFSYVRVTKPATTPAPVAERPRDRKADAAAPPVPPARLRPEQVRRTFALVVDDLLMSAESVSYARRALKKYVDEQIEPGDMVAIIRTSSGVGALQQFTNDRQALYRAIQRVSWSPRRGGSATPFSAPGASNPAVVPGEVDADRTSPKDFDEYRKERFTIGTMGALQFVVRGLREMPGRKAVVLFSDGFPLRDSRGDAARYTSALDRLIDLANRASVVFYGVDTRGLQPLGPFASDDTAGSPAAPGGAGPGGPLSGTAGIPTQQIGASVIGPRSAYLFETQAGLIKLSEATGGTALINQNDLNKGIRRALDDMSGYYLIGYRPDESAFDATGRPRMNHIEVKVKGHPNLRVRSRTGYIGLPETESQPKPHTRAEQLMAALVTPFGAAGVNLRLTSFFIDAPGGGTVVRSMLLIDPATLTFRRQPDGQQQTSLDIVAVTIGEDGRVVDQMNRIETIRVPEDSLERFKKEGMVYDLNVPVQRPGAYQLRIAVRDSATERTGSASQYVEVPDLSKKRLALSGIVVASPQAAGAQVVPAALTDQQADPATRRFRRGALLDYGFVIYNARVAKATGRPQLTVQARLFREGKEVYAGQPQPFDPGQQSAPERVEAAGRIQLGAALEPGEYVLQLVVTDALASKSNAVATQWIDFELVN